MESGLAARRSSLQEGDLILKVWSNKGCTALGGTQYLSFGWLFAGLCHCRGQAEGVLGWLWGTAAGLEAALPGAHILPCSLATPWHCTRTLGDQLHLVPGAAACHLHPPIPVAPVLCCVWVSLLGEQPTSSLVHGEVFGAQQVKRCSRCLGRIKQKNGGWFAGVGKGPGNAAVGAALCDQGFPGVPFPGASTLRPSCSAPPDQRGGQQGHVPG